MDGYSTGSGPLSRQRARRERFYGLFIREIGKPGEAAAAEAAAYSSIGAGPCKCKRVQCGTARVVAEHLCCAGYLPVSSQVWFRYARCSASLCSARFLRLCVHAIAWSSAWFALGALDTWISWPLLLLAAVAIKLPTPAHIAGQVISTGLLNSSASSNLVRCPSDYT
jgi:hypothetical protein